MTTSPTWSAVDDTTADLLTILAEKNQALPVWADEWDWFLHILREAAKETGVIDQNDVRAQLRERVRPARIGAYYRRACLQGLIRTEGWNESNDLEQRNAGKPTRTYRWLGTTTSARPARGQDGRSRPPEPTSPGLGT
ncbi:hypothetical protein ACIRON_03030 [Nocardioides sp. NPDC101246]|uniref:hypothetical protein n=1 Tax=Nocardioides sp. NPDC101246 TaxID=3364336 RepID=UPI0038206A01